MKKFMRIALVFALAGATLVGCTKDYSGDISDLNKKVAEQQSAVTALQNAVSNAQTAADNALANAQNALKEAQEAAKAAAAANNDAEVAALTERVAAIEGEIAELEAKVEALDGLEAKLNEVAEQLKKDVDAKVDAALEEIRAEVAALIESVGVTDFEIIYPYYPDGLDIVYGQFNGVFSGLKATTWDGPRAEEVAALEKGSYISSSNVDFLRIQVNPVNADLSDVDFGLEDMDGNVAPVDFYPAIAYEDLKAASGVWVLPFAVGEITEEFVKRESKEQTSIWTEHDGNYASLVYSESVRSNYIPVVVEQADKNAFGTFTSKTIAQKKATGSYTFEPTGPQYVFDAFITNTINCEYNVAKFDVEFDGLTISYDVDAVNEYFKTKEAPIKFNFQVKQLNVNGYVKAQTAKTDFISFTITKTNADPTPATKHEAVMDVTATHEATPARTINNVPTQSITIDLAEVAKEWGIEAGSAARAIWEKEFFTDGTPVASIEDAIFYPSADSSIEGDATELFDGVAFGKKDGKWNGKATIYFSENYEEISYVNAEGATKYVDPIGEVVELTFKLEDTKHKDAYIVTVPVQVTAPTAESIASWYKVSEITKYYDDVTAAKAATIDLSTAFSATKAFENCELALAFGTKFSPDYTELWAATQVKGTDALAADKTYDDLGAYVGDLDYLAFKHKDSKAPAHFVVDDPDWADGTEFHFVGSKSATFEVENLFVEAIGERLYPISNVTVNIKCINEGQTSELSFAPAIELARKAGADNFWTATNSAFKPYAGAAYLGREFTLTGPNGNVVKIASKANVISEIKTATTKASGAWVFGESLVDASVVAYDTNAGSAQSIELVKAYGLNFALKNNYTGDSNVIRVKLTFKANSLVYVTTGTKINSEVVVEFDINMK